MKHLLCLLLAFCLMAASARGGTFKDADAGFSLEAPDGWTPMSLSDVETATALVSPDPNLKCFAGFEHGDSGLLLLSVSPYPDGQAFTTLTMKQIQQTAGAFTGIPTAEFHSAPGPAIGNMGAGTTRQVTCLSYPPGFVIDYQQAKEATRSHSVAYLGRNHVVILHFFMKSSDYPFVKRSMDEIAGSFQFNSRQALSLKTSSDAPLDASNWGIYFFVALLLAAAGFIVRYLFKRQAY